VCGKFGGSLNQCRCAFPSAPFSVSSLRVILRVFLSLISGLAPVVGDSIILPLSNAVVIIYRIPIRCV